MTIFQDTKIGGEKEQGEDRRIEGDELCRLGGQKEYNRRLCYFLVTFLSDR